MLNPNEVYKLASLSAEKARISSSIYKHIMDKEEEMLTLSLANTMEDDLCSLIMQSANKGYMQYSISDLIYVDSFANLSSSVVKEVLFVMESIVRKAKGKTFNQNIKISEYPVLLNNMLIENMQFESRVMNAQSKIPSFAFLDVLNRFESAGFLVISTIELGQKVNIHIRWGGEHFIPNPSNIDTQSFAKIKIAELLTEVNGLRNIEQLQANYEDLLEVNKKLRRSMEYLLSLKENKKGFAHEGKSGEIPQSSLS